MSVTVAVAFALDAEFAPWRTRRHFGPAPIHGCFEGPVGGATVRVAIVGIGARRLPHCSSWLFDRDRVDAVVAAGLSGATTPAHHPGDVLVAARVCRDRDELESDDRLVARAASSGAVRAGRLVTIDRLAIGASAKQALASRGDIVDMESYLLLDAARRCGIPGIAVRSVGDSSSEDLPLDFERAMRDDGSLSKAAIVALAAGHPAAWMQLVRFARAQRRALAALAAFLDRFTAAIAQEPTR